MRFGPPSGSFWELLRVSWELRRASGSTKEGLQIRLGTFLGLVCLLRAAEGGLRKVLGSSLARFIPSRSLLGSILSSQTDPPTFKNHDFLCEILTFLENRRFRSNDGFEIVMGLCRAPFGRSWGSPGGLLGVPSGLWIDQRGPPDSSWNSLGLSLIHI